MTSIRVLGSMGWMPARGQETACVLVELKHELILLDGGTGTANLAFCEDVLERYDRISVILSHYHLDHVAGLMYLKRFVADKQVDVYGPGLPAYERTTEEYLSDVLQPATYSSGPHGFAREVRYHDYGGEEFRIGSVRVGVCPQRHSAPSFQLRLDDELVYATDTSFDPTEWVGIRPAALLLHECWQLEDDDARHTGAKSLALGLPDAFSRVVLVHQNPSWSDGERDAVEDAVRARGFALAYDGMAIGW